MLVTVDWLTTNYDRCNKLYFGGALPKVKMKVGRSKYNWGYASYKIYNGVIYPLSITLSNYYESPEDVKLNTLIHEMIHIKDYVEHPEHFVRGRRINRSYDAHGSWFLSECNRLKQYGFDIAAHVTKEEEACSTLSKSAMINEANKKKDALVCVISGERYNWMFKTSRQNLSTALKSAVKYNWSRLCGNITGIKLYSFSNDQLALIRSVATKLNGWKYSHTDLEKRLKEINAIEITTLKKSLNTIYKKLAA